MWNSHDSGHKKSVTDMVPITDSMLYDILDTTVRPSDHAGFFLVIAL